MAVCVKVMLEGSLHRLCGMHGFTVCLDGDTTLLELINTVAERYTQEFKECIYDPRMNPLILINGKEISVLKGLETIIEDGDEVTFLPVTHGG